MDWDNLRFFLELARAGTLVGAARRLGVDHTTVARRIQGLEKQVDAALFAREAGGHRLTEAGRALLPRVEAMEAAFLAVQSAAPGVGTGLHGVVRIGTTSITIDVEVYAERLQPHRIVKVTEATLTYVAIGADGRPRPVPRT